MPACLFVPLSQKLVTLRELQEYYSVEDCLTLWEMAKVNDYNARLWSEMK